MQSYYAYVIRGVQHPSVKTRSKGNVGHEFLTMARKVVEPRDNLAEGDLRVIAFEDFLAVHLAMI
eukprot:10451730-Lingulodinium_polyedra.AAC.1